MTRYNLLNIQTLVWIPGTVFQSVIISVADPDPDPDPDPHDSAFILVGWTGLDRIRIGNTDPDPGGPKGLGINYLQFLIKKM